MKILEIHIEADDYGEGDYYILNIDGKDHLEVSGGEPEDNSLSRDLNFVYGITDLMKLTYEAGMRKEPLQFDSIAFKDYNEYEEWQSKNEESKK